MHNKSISSFKVTPCAPSHRGASGLLHTVQALTCFDSSAINAEFSSSKETQSSVNAARFAVYVTAVAQIVRNAVDGGMHSHWR